MLFNSERNEMRNGAFVLMLCLGSTLLGCSSKPDVGDIEAQLKKGWGMCQGLKMTDLKKVNGVDQGKNYEMAVSYNLQITKNATAEEAWYKETICPSPSMLQMFWAYGKLAQKFGQPLKVGDVITVNDTFTMIKSEKGWITQ
jgi:hypothetical protein